MLNKYYKEQLGEEDLPPAQSWLKTILNLPIDGSSPCDIVVGEVTQGRDNQNRGSKSHSEGRKFHRFQCIELRDATSECSKSDPNGKDCPHGKVEVHEGFPVTE